MLGEARSAGLTAQMELAGRSLKGQLGLANALGARYVAIVGEDETVLKDMQGRRAGTTRHGRRCTRRIAGPAHALRAVRAPTEGRPRML